jgi:predicted nucleotidyltransferase component of viral defense system
MLSTFQICEVFHLYFLRSLCAKLQGRPFAVKGGICLRFFHRSPRLSEDIDLDIGSKIQVNTLGKTVDGILQGQALQSSLVSAGVQQLNFSKPKQTETTQRWKVSLSIGPDTVLSTKIEFSRRSLKNISRGIPDSELLHQYRLPPFAAPYYDADLMAAQKLEALAAPSRLAVRDLFDLHHLLTHQQVDLKKINRHVMPKTFRLASDKIRVFSFRDFAEQVTPFLTPELAELYQDSSSVETLKEETCRQLSLAINNGN